MLILFCYICLFYSYQLHYLHCSSASYIFGTYHQLSVPYYIFINNFTATSQANSKMWANNLAYYKLPISAILEEWWGYTL